MASVLRDASHTVMTSQEKTEAIEYTIRRAEKGAGVNYEPPKVKCQSRVMETWCPIPDDALPSVARS